MRLDPFKGPREDGPFVSEVGFNDGMNRAQVLSLVVLGALAVHLDSMLPAEGVSGGENLLDPREFFRGKMQAPGCPHAILHLTYAAGADEGAGHNLVP